MDITCDLEFQCGRCGRDVVVSQDSRGYVMIEPCDKCLEEEYNKGENKGYKDGIVDGREDA